MQINVVVPPTIGQRTIHTTLDPQSFRDFDSREQQVIKGFEVAGPAANEQPPLHVDVVVDVRADAGSPNRDMHEEGS